MTWSSEIVGYNVSMISKIIKGAFTLGCLGLSVACSSGQSEGVSADNANFQNQDFIVLEKGAQSKFSGESTLVFQSFRAWQNHYELHTHGSSSFSSIQAPSVDFSSEDMVAIHIGVRPHLGYGVRVKSFSYDSTDGVYHIRYAETIDDSVQWPAQVATPYTFVRVPRTDLESLFASIPHCQMAVNLNFRLNIHRFDGLFENLAS
jgi:hypothetical protein